MLSSLAQHLPSLPSAQFPNKVCNHMCIIVVPDYVVLAVEPLLLPLHLHCVGDKVTLCGVWSTEQFSLLPCCLPAACATPSLVNSYCAHSVLSGVVPRVAWGGALYTLSTIDIGHAWVAAWKHTVCRGYEPLGTGVWAMQNHRNAPPPHDSPETPAHASPCMPKNASPISVGTARTSYYLPSH